jgi:hypothetical protein
LQDRGIDAATHSNALQDRGIDAASAAALEDKNINPTDIQHKPGMLAAAVALFAIIKSPIGNRGYIRGSDCSQRRNGKLGSLEQSCQRATYYTQPILFRENKTRPITSGNLELKKSRNHTFS